MRASSFSKTCRCESIVFSSVLSKVDVDIVDKPTLFLLVKNGSRHARAAVARMWPTCYYLSGIVPLASARMLLSKFSARATIAREVPFDRNVEKPLVFRGLSKRARADILKLFDEEVMCFHKFN